MFYLCYLYLFTFKGVQHDLYQIMFVSFNSTTAGATSGAETAIPSEAPEFTPGF